MTITFIHKISVHNFGRNYKNILIWPHYRMLAPGRKFTPESQTIVNIDVSLSRIDIWQRDLCAC